MMVAMMAMLLLSALGIALALTTASETIISANFSNASEGAYAADAVLERSMEDLLTEADWDTLLTGSVRSAFIDGPPSGTRSLPDGSTIDLGQVLNRANCNKVTPCSDVEMDTVTLHRPWGSNNPRWQLFAYGRLSDMLPPGAIVSPYYVIAMVGDDPSETDGQPLQDGVDMAGAGVLSLRAEAFGPRGARRIVEMTVARTPKVRVLAWREVRATL